MQWLTVDWLINKLQDLIPNLKKQFKGIVNDHLNISQTCEDQLSLTKTLVSFFLHNFL